MKNFFFDLVSGLGELLYPRICIGCRRRLAGPDQKELVCASCWSAIERTVPPLCGRCGRPLRGAGATAVVCPECRATAPCFDRAYAPCSYTGVLKELIAAFKYKGKDYLSESLGRLLVEFIREYRLPLETIDTLVPIPLHSARLREREFNQAELLAREVAKAYDKPVTTGLLARLRYTRTQTELAADRRRQNVLDCFRVIDRTAAAGKNILLIDDVLTTGATLSEAARCLKEAGAGTVLALTLAH
jgi:ComF family protein